MNIKNTNDVATNVPEMECIKEYRVMYLDLMMDEQRILLPPLHVLFFPQPGPNGEPGIEGVCLELGQFAWGNDINEVAIILENLAKIYFRERVENNEFQEILNDVSSSYMDPYWALCRRMSVVNAAMGREDTIIQFIEEFNNLKSSTAKLNKKFLEAQKIIEQQNLLIRLLAHENNRIKSNSNVSYLYLGEMMKCQRK